MTIIKPSLVINKAKVFKNIELIGNKAKSNNLIFRPHFKTHNSIEVASWFREFGVDKCTVSSVEMAEKFASSGWTDITIAFPCNILEINQINYLNSRVTINLLVDNLNTAAFLERNLSSSINIYIKINTGKDRAGRAIENIDLLDQLASYIKHSEKLIFKGLLTHAGNSYGANSKEEILQIHNISLAKMRAAKAYFSKYFNQCLISIGDTPTVKLADSFPGADEIRPGVFVYYDLMMQELEVCNQSEIAAYLVAPICGIYPERNENNLLIYAGSIHLSKESILINNENIYGEVIKIDNYSESTEQFSNNIYIRQLSQEHALCTVSKEDLKSLKIGQLLGVLPVHACLVANQVQNQIIN
ncbi:alanine racemase [Candidatus Kapabacteria bacterium]|nr:alanine racemase [Candidatus Kapabacteria bacterium]